MSTGVFNRGISVGEIKRAKETTYELHAMGMPAEQIARAVKVSVDKVRQWLAEPQTT